MFDWVYGIASTWQNIIFIPHALRLTHQDFIRYYVAHEVAHFVAGKAAKHGPRFQNELVDLIPEELYDYEREYKPRQTRSL